MTATLAAEVVSGSVSGPAPSLELDPARARRVALLLVVTAAASIAGCGGGERASATRSARLVVYERRLPDAVTYIEGSIGIVRVERPDGSLVAQERRHVTGPPGRRAVVFDRRVPAGLYRVVSFQATCAPACGGDTDPMSFDPFRSQECQRPVRLEPGATTWLVSELGADARRCRFRGSRE